MALTAAAIKNAKGKAKPYKLTDSDGLFLYVALNGGRYWRMNYRHLGKQKTLAFEIYPDIGLADAREQRDVARKVLAKGNDPAEKIRLDRIAATVAASNSFKAVADEWLVRVEREGRSSVTMKKPLAAGLYQCVAWQAACHRHHRAGGLDHAAQNGGQRPL
ncbi:Arm DNA-binding domain-containing protein [Sphingobium sp. Leaf26]|uniref:Arm DNA-binding domain-containing protein n=1 Tax=Sphingobium sp. Leaf26 TaxID=1735693 RepID=UPI000A484A50|nr:Arm DNA-binding domain-containing protein [Sphingobium sp. Leaf26]